MRTDEPREQNKTDRPQFVEKIKVSVVCLRGNPGQGVQNWLGWAARPQPEGAVADAKEPMPGNLNVERCPNVCTAGQVRAFAKQIRKGTQNLTKSRQSRFNDKKQVQARQQYQACHDQ